MIVVEEVATHKAETISKQVRPTYRGLSEKSVASSRASSRSYFPSDSKDSCRRQRPSQSRLAILRERDHPGKACRQELEAELGTQTCNCSSWKGEERFDVSTLMVRQG